MRHAICIALLLPLAAQPTRADDGKLASALANAFVGNCLQALPDLKRIEAAARVMGAKLVEGDAATMLAPEDPKAEWKGWLVNRGPAPPYFLAISTGTVHNESMAICTVMNRGAPADLVLKQLTVLLKLGAPIANDTSLGQRTRAWNISLNGKSAILTVIDASPTSEPGVTMSAMTKAAR
jgi:hypothetical protein